MYVLKIDESAQREKFIAPVNIDTVLEECGRVRWRFTAGFEEQRDCAVVACKIKVLPPSVEHRPPGCDYTSPDPPSMSPGGSQPRFARSLILKPFITR
jgi:hypothetical protein